MQHRRAAARGGERQQHLVPQHAPVEAPGIQARLAQRAHLGAGGAQRGGKIARVDARAGRRAQRELGVERDDHGAQRFSGGAQQRIVLRVAVARRAQGAPARVGLRRARAVAARGRGQRQPGVAVAAVGDDLGRALVPAQRVGGVAVRQGLVGGREQVGVVVGRERQRVAVRALGLAPERRAAGRVGVAGLRLQHAQPQPGVAGDLLRPAVGGERAHQPALVGQRAEQVGRGEGVDQGLRAHHVAGPHVGPDRARAVALGLRDPAAQVGRLGVVRARRPGAARPRPGRRRAPPPRRARAGRPGTGAAAPRRRGAARPGTTAARRGRRRPRSMRAGPTPRNAASTSAARTSSGRTIRLLQRKEPETSRSQVDSRFARIRRVRS